MWVSDASVAWGMVEFGEGCASGTVAASTCFLRWKVLSRAADHSSVFLPPSLRAAVSGSRTAAIPGVKQR